METVHDHEREFFFKKQIHPLLLRHIVDLDSAIASRDAPCGSHRADPVLLLFAFQRFHQFVFVLLGDGAKQTRHFINLGGDVPGFDMPMLLQIKGKNGNLFAVQIFVDGNLEDIFVLFFAGFDVRSVSAGASTRREVVGATQDSHCERVPDLETSAERIA